MKRITESQIRQRCEDWGFDPDDEEDRRTAKESLYIERMDREDSVRMDVLFDGVV